jgi:glycosyltransferase involved in cell wall biosynthesis
MVAIGNSLPKVNFGIRGLVNRIRNLFKKKGRVVLLSPHSGQTSRGCVVISYLTWPFENGITSEKMRGHTNAGEVLVMAEIFRGLGFRVEVCDWDDEVYSPPRDAKVAIDIHGNLERWVLPDECLKVLHATGAHPTFQNQAESTRLQAVSKRRGVVLMPRRTSKPSRGAEVADHIVVLGNEFTGQTFRYAGKPITRIPISSAYQFHFLEKRDYSTACRRFLWIGSYGMVHKGLDLVLEAFEQMPELELTVCGRPEKEGDFYRLYEKELKHTPNIHFHGWVDMDSESFHEIARTHVSVVYPSCSEGGGGSVIHCLHAGMIPVCTSEASVDLNDFGVLICDGSVSSVKEAVQKIARMSVSELDERARKAWNHAQKNHTIAEFSRNYKRFAASLTENIT